MALHTIPVRKFNPYEQIGTVHNDAITYFAKNAPADYTMNDVLRLSCTSVLDSLKGKDEYDDLDLLNLEGVAGCAFNTMFLPDNASDSNFIPINVEAIIKANHFNELQAMFTRVLLSPSTSLELADYKSVVINIEGHVLKSELSCSEQFPLLAATAVGKATVDYWVKELKDPKSPWTQPVALKKWWKYVLADAAGALAGAAGGPLGAAGGAAGATILYALD